MSSVKVIEATSGGLENIFKEEKLDPPIEFFYGRMASLMVRLFS